MKFKMLVIFLFFFLSQFQSNMADEWKRVYLATYPRSGNHWVRALVEEASHIVTGAVYCDQEPPHLPKPLPWGGYSCDHGYAGDCRYPKKTDRVLIKTHWPGQKRKISEFDNQPSLLTIRIIRNPVDSFYSQYVKRSHGHPPTEIVPTYLVKECIYYWKKFQKHWNEKKRVISFRYEDMLEEPREHLRKILEYLKYDFTEEDIERAVTKHPPEGELFKHIKHFKVEDLKMIFNELKDLLEQFDYANSLEERIEEISA